MWAEEGPTAKSRGTEQAALGMTAGRPHRVFLSQHIMPGSGSILAPLVGLGDQVTWLDAQAMVSPAHLSGFPEEGDFGKDTIFLGFLLFICQ